MILLNFSYYYLNVYFKPVYFKPDNDLTSLKLFFVSNGTLEIA